jgi:type II secretory pathway component GspD/PulD (secretin)
MKCNERQRRKTNLAGRMLGMTLALSAIGPAAWAQPTPADAKTNPESVQIFYLTNASQAGLNQPNDANEIVTAMRNILSPGTKIYLLPSQNAIVLRADPDQLALARKLIADLDRAKQTYRLTYTISETDGGKRVGVQHFAMVLSEGERTTLKQGSRVPLVTGSTTASSAGTESQVTYIDVGLNFDAILTKAADGANLRAKVAQTSVAEERSGVGLQDPVIRQTALEGTSFLPFGKPVVLGSIDVPGSTRHLEVEVVMTLVP